MKFTFDWKEYAKVARAAVAEGCVLLKNDKNTLPIKDGQKVSVFGRIQFDYYKSGMGSGGMVNAPYVVSILDALKAYDKICLNTKLQNIYEEWLEDNPFDRGPGWGREPWCQKEMPISAETAKQAAEESDMALIIIGRAAGEDNDNNANEGSHKLTQLEEEMIQHVCAAFEKVAVVLNVGNIIDMSFVEKYNPQAVLYAWQGGMEGGNGVLDVLTGAVNPCGKLTDTIAYTLEDYPSAADFGDEIENFYTEDIYVGYRYFETVAKDRVQYPFGFGLSYTTFGYEVLNLNTKGDTVQVSVQVENTGSVAGKEVIQVYYNPPQGQLSKPLRNLVRFAKTQLLQPGEKETLTMEFAVKEMASFDDGGVTGHPFCFVLEAGAYEILVGTDVRSAKKAGEYAVSELQVTEQLEEALAPVQELQRMRLLVKPDGTVEKTTELAPMRTVDVQKRITENRPKEAVYTGDRGYRFKDVMEGKVSDDEYLAQIPDEELLCMSRGEGMCPVGVTPGIAGSFGGVTEGLEKFGMPRGGCADGPSGIRMDCGTMAFSLPNGTSLACSFNLALVEELFEWEGKELRKNKIDTLLGPGMNIHRHPLNGRNFEYFSEDPYVTGAMATAMLKGMKKYNVTGTIKHFACNNQEFSRHKVDSVVSQRALREIYLKGYEMAVKEGGAYSIMTTYAPVNGIWTAGNYDLNTLILRKEWGYKGQVMTDWWAKMNEEYKAAPSNKNISWMIRAQNDLYMVAGSSATNSMGDDGEEGLKLGRITRADLVRNAKNILNVLKISPAGIRVVEGEDDITELNRPKTHEIAKNQMPGISLKAGEDNYLDVSTLDTQAGSCNQYALNIPTPGLYEIRFKLKSDLGELAQSTMSIFVNNILYGSVTISGTKGEWVEKTAHLEAKVSIDNYMDLQFGQSGIEVGEIVIRRIGENRGFR